IDLSGVRRFAQRHGDLDRVRVQRREVAAKYAVIAAAEGLRRGGKKRSGQNEGGAEFCAHEDLPGENEKRERKREAFPPRALVLHGVTILNQNGNLSSMPTNSANASRLPSSFISPEVIACSGVISPSWMRSSTVLVSVIFASAFGTAFFA